MRVLVVTNMHPSPEKPAFGVFIRDQVASLRKLGVEIDVFFVDGRESKLNYFKAYPRFWNHLRKNKYDLIHAHYVFSGLIARAQWRYPVVLTHHGPEVLMTWQAPLCKIVTPYFEKIIVVSQELKDKLRYEKAHIIPCGVDFERFKPMTRMEARDALGLPQDKKLILWAGEYWRPEKRFDLVESSVAIVKANDPSADLVLLSGKPHSEVAAYMNACDALLLVSDGEGSPMVVKEAMACNLPVVSVHVGDVAQVIGETDGCYLVERDPGKIAEKLQMALDAQMRTNGREDVQRMSLDSVARRIVDVYEDTLGNNHSVATASSSERVSPKQ